VSGVAWVELCAGTAAVAHRLVGGADHDSAVTYQGAKRRYATAVLSALGLRPGQGAARVVLNDPGTWGRAWQSLVEPATVQEAVHLLRAWHRAGDEGRALFDRLEDAGQPADGAAWLAAFLALQDGAFGGKPVMAISSGAWSTPGYARSARQLEGEGTNEPRHFKWRLNPAGLARRLSRAGTVRWPASTTILRKSAAELDPGEIGVDARTFVYIDPPYAGTTGYGPTLSRAEVVEVARRFGAAGAVVAISEGEPVAELTGDGWQVVDITTAHRGQPRSFAKSRREFLTMNRPPHGRPAVQPSLFDLDEATACPA
jgi:hypothetical protein